MTRRTARSEERLARLRVADENGRRLLTRLVVARGLERVDERGDVRDLIDRQRELRHPAISAAVLHDWRDPFAALIVEDDSGSQEARSAIPAARIGAVTERAVDPVQRASAFNRCRIGRRPIGIGVAWRRDRRSRGRL